MNKTAQDSKPSGSIPRVGFKQASFIQVEGKCLNQSFLNGNTASQKLNESGLLLQEQSMSGILDATTTSAVPEEEPSGLVVDGEVYNLYQPVLQRHRTTTKRQMSSYLGQQRQSVSSNTNGVLKKGEKRSPTKGGNKQVSKFDNQHKNHRINQAISFANEFLTETFLRPNDQPVNFERVKFICQNFFCFKLPRQVLNDPPKVKSKDFQIYAKERILQKLYDIINSENRVQSDWIQACQQFPIKKFHVGKGNNYPLVRSILKQRWWWQLCQEGEDFDSAQFIWTSIRKNDLLEYLQPLKIVEETQTCMKDGKPRVYSKLEDNFHLSNKKALFWNMTQFYKQLGEDPFQVLPLTFHIENGLRDLEFDKFRQYYNILEEEKKQKTLALKLKKKEFIKKKRKQGGYGSEDGSDEDDEEYLAECGDDIEAYFNVKVPRNIWILKPGENSNRGHGITVCSNMKEVIAEINSAEKAEHTHIIQRYIERPLLINNRKFDIRCYGLLTSVNGIMKGYFYEDGYIRTSSSEYDLEDLGNRFIHLTNDAVQKKSDDYGKYENGNKLSYQNFQKYIDQNLPASKKCNFHSSLLPQIRKIVTDTFKATFTKLDPKRRCHSFEIFGYDFMIDDDMNVFLIEANTNPCLELSCPLLARIIPAMLDSAFRLALDPLFPPRSDASAAKKNANTLPEMLPINKFELVFDERIEGEKLREILRGQEAFNLKIDVNDECGDDCNEEEEVEDPESPSKGDSLIEGKKKQIEDKKSS